MKKRSVSLNRKLFLTKETIAALDNNHQAAVIGGATADEKGCGVRLTVQVNCGPLTENDLCCQLTLYCPVVTNDCQ